MDVDSLPLWLQIVMAVGVLVGGAFAAVKGYSSKREEHGTSTGEGVVVSASFADKPTMLKIVAALEGNTSAIEANTHAVSRLVPVTHECADAVKVLKDAVDRLTLETVRNEK